MQTDIKNITQSINPLRGKSDQKEKTKTQEESFWFWKIPTNILLIVSLIAFLVVVCSLFLTNIQIISIESSVLKNFYRISSILIIISYLAKIAEFAGRLFRKYPKDLILKGSYEMIPNEYKDQVIAIIPAYNEEDCIGNAINACLKYVNTVLVIDDGSDDKTINVAENAGAIIVSHRINQGLAQAMRTGIQKSIELGAQVIVNFDADLQYDAADIPSLVMPVINNRCDLMIGNRFEGGIEEMPLIKRFGNKAFSRVIANLTKTHISDAQSGFRAFSVEFAQAVKIRPGFTYTQQMIIEAAVKHFKINEYPIYFSKRANGESRLMRGPINFAWRAWKLLLQVYSEYKPLKLIMIPGSLHVLFILLGTLFGLYQMLTNQTIGIIVLLGVAVLLCSLSIHFWIGMLAQINKEDSKP